MVVNNTYEGVPSVHHQQHIAYNDFQRHCPMLLSIQCLEEHPKILIRTAIIEDSEVNTKTSI